MFRSVSGEHVRPATPALTDELIALSGTLFVEGDVHGLRFTRVSRAWRNVLGWAAEELTARAWRELVHPDDVIPLLECQKTLASGREVVRFECRQRQRDGGYRWLAFNLAPRKGSSAFHGVAHDITESKASGDVALATEARYRALFNAIPDGFALVRVLFDDGRPVDYRFEEVNDAFSVETGLSTPVGRTALELVPGLEPFWIETYGAVAQQQTSVRFENEAAPMGRWFEVHAFPFGTAGDHVAIFFRDISLRKRAEARQRFLLRLDDVVRPLTDAEAITRAAAALVADELGVDRCVYAEVEEDEDLFNVIGNHTVRLPSVVGRYRLGAFGSEGTRLNRAGFPFVVEDVENDPAAGPDLSAYRDTGIRALISVPLHKAGRFVAKMAVHQKVPRRWTAHEVELLSAVANRCWESIERARVARALATRDMLYLRKADQRFREMANIAPAILWVTEPDGSCTFVSRGWHEYTGQTEGTALGFGWLQATHPEDRARATAIFMEAHQKQEPFELDYRIRRADGVYRWAVDAGRPRFDGSGTFLGFVGSVFDITERKEAEERREQILEAERAARTESERVGRMKDEFVATLSHELRTPLNAILGWSQLLKSNKLSPADAPRALDTIERNAQLQKQLIEDLLDISRIISGKVRLDLRCIDLLEVVKAAIESVQPTADAKGVRLLVRDESREVLVIGDAARLQQVVWNLMSNAVKFTPKRGQVEVVVTKTAGNGEVHVRDTGVGIDPQFLPHVFERFAQADAAITRRFGGLGLGLSIVKQLVEMHNGQVRAESEGCGKGATFSVAVPLAFPEQSEVDPSRDSSPHLRARRAVSSDAVTLDGLKVLVVDDNVDSRELVKSVLERHEATVISSPSAREGLAAIESERPDLLVSDIGMPELDGYELIRRVRELGDQGGRVRALALTAYARDADRARALRAGFDAHVAKPIDPAELVATVASLAGRVS